MLNASQKHTFDMSIRNCDIFHSSPPSLNLANEEIKLSLIKFFWICLKKIVALL